MIEVAVTDKDGKFKIDLAPGAYRVQIADKNVGVSYSGQEHIEVGTS